MSEIKRGTVNGWECDNCRRIMRVYDALKWGRLTKADACEDCGTTAKKLLHAHHEDYAKPLEVTWLCQDCHAGRHAPERVTS